MKSLVIIVILLILPMCFASQVQIPQTFKSDSTQVTSYFYTGNSLVATKDSNGIKYYSQDRLGSNRLTTNNLGVKLGEEKTLPFGEEILNTADNKFTFTGKELDSDLYYFGARYYDSNTGRFTSVDPVPTEPDYQYVANNPMNYIDPSGKTMKFSYGKVSNGEDYTKEDVNNILNGVNKIFGKSVLYMDEADMLGINKLELNPSYPLYKEKTEIYNMFNLIVESFRQVDVSFDTVSLTSQGEITMNPRIVEVNPFGEVGQEIELTPVTRFVHESSHVLSYVRSDEKYMSEVSAVNYENYARRALGMGRRDYYALASYEDSGDAYMLITPKLFELSKTVDEGVDYFAEKYMKEGLSYQLFVKGKDYMDASYVRRPWKPNNQ